MTAKRTLYAWRDGDKYCLSAIRKGALIKRPFNNYASEAELMAEVRRRGAKVEWERTDGQ